MSRVVAIHQPDFLPWLGFFVKIAKSDVFVVLDHTENNPRRAFLCKRVSFQLPGSVGFLGLVLEHPADGRVSVPLAEMRLAAEMDRNLVKMERSVEQAYKRAPFFDEVFPLVAEFLRSEEPRLVQRNMMFIDQVLERLAIRPERVYSSTLTSTARAGELVAELCVLTGGDVYLSGEGGRDYQSPASFESRGIRLAYNHFKPREYPRFQGGAFVPGLSVVDALMNLGFAGTAALVAEEVALSEARARAVGEAVHP
ncbi:MAG TPA: WbqC family protein [Polyangiaceae bacterium]|nr:WbqC family protein [Polyangiaceae bacterium]